MQVKLDIPASVIANMMTSAIESGDPVTTASKGGWCNGINLKGGEKAIKQLAINGCWWADESIYDNPKCVLEIVEVVDETTGEEKVHTVRLADFERGLTVMAKSFPRQFAQVLSGDTDAPCADVFLQSTLFGQEKYA